MRLRPAFVGVGLVVLVTGLLAQAPPQDHPSFDSVSVKLSSAGDAPPSLGFLSGGLLRAINITARELIRTAYRLQGFQIIGGPSWVGTDKFDVIAKAAGSPVSTPGDAPGPPASMFLMLRSFLAERFKVTVHSETRDLPIYAIVVARSDGKLGPQLRRPAVDCSNVDVRIAPPSPDVFCGIRPGSDGLTGRAATMAQLALNLSMRVGRVVIDRTGLMGAFDLDLAWTSAVPPDTSGPVAADVGASLFTAMQEQLGLKLESTTGPVNVLVIDHIEHPTEN